MDNFAIIRIDLYTILLYFKNVFSFVHFGCFVAFEARGISEILLYVFFEDVIYSLCHLKFTLLLNKFLVLTEVDKNF